MNFKTVLLAILKTLNSFLDSISLISLVWSIGFSLVVELTEKLLFRDWDFLSFLIVPFLMDWFFGTWVAIREGKFNIERIYDVIAKVFVYAGILVLGHVLSYFVIGGKEAGYPLVSKVFYSMLILYEAHSALKNMGKVYPRAALIQWAEGKLAEIIKSKQSIDITGGKS